MKNLTFLIILTLFVYSCGEKFGKEAKSKECMLKKLEKFDINAEIIVVSNSEYEIVLHKPYKTVDKSQQKLLIESLIHCLEQKNKRTENLNFNVYLDKEKDILVNNFFYQSLELDKELKNQNSDQVLKKMHEYILNEFDKKDMIVLNNLIIGLYNSYKYKEDIYNLKFIDLVRHFRNEKDNKSDKARLTFLMLYASSKNSKAADLKNIPNHLKSLWNMHIKDNIDTVLEETFK